MLVQVIGIALASFGFLFVSQTGITCSAEDDPPLDPNINTKFDLSKVYHMPWKEVQANFVSIIETMRRETFDNLKKYFNNSELVTFQLTPTHGENATFLKERWHDMLDYFLDPGNDEHFKLYVLNRFPITQSTWWGPLPSSKPTKKPGA